MIIGMCNSARLTETAVVICNYKLFQVPSMNYKKSIIWGCELDSHIHAYSVQQKMVMALDTVTAAGVWTANRMYWTLQHTTRDYAVQLLLHKVYWSQSLSPPIFW
jgi:hypothetical protein